VKDYIDRKFTEQELEEERSKNLEEGTSKNKIKNGMYMKYTD